MKQVLLVLVAVFAVTMLCGCGALTFMRQGEVTDGMPVVNSTHYSIVVYRNGDAWSGFVPPGGDIKIPMTNWLGRSDTISVYAKAYEGANFVGTADHGTIYLAPYETRRDAWIVRDGDVRR